MSGEARNRRALLKPFVVLGVLAVLLAFAGEGQPAHAATFTVTKTADTNDGVCDADCSLREAVGAANALPGADTITVPAGTYTLSIAGAGEDANATGDLDIGRGDRITADLTINGAGATSTFIDAAALGDRVFHIPGGSNSASVEIFGLTIRNSSFGGIRNEGTLALTNSTVSGNSVGVVNIFGPLTLTNSTVSGNTGGLDGEFGGGIANIDGTVTLNSSTVSGNSAGRSGGGIYLTEFGTLTLNDSTVSGNSAGGAGGIDNSAGTVTLNSSTISGNSAGGAGGILNEGTLTLNSSTVSGNSAGFFGGGGILNLIIGTLTLNSSTVSGNSAFGALGGGGIRNVGTATLKNTIVANSTAGGDCAGIAPTSSGDNLSSDSTCGLTATGDLQNTDPLLGLLADNGGPTQTHALLPGSPAIDAVPVADCTDTLGNPVTTDQRGVARPQGAACDIGAFELEGVDGDGDGVLDADDACPTTPGDPERQGCPVGDANTVTLHTIDQQKSAACPGGKGSCKSPIDGAEVRVFDRNILNGLTITKLDASAVTLTKNPNGSLYDDIFEASEASAAQVGACTTNAGQCTAGEETTGDYLVIVRYFDVATGKTVYTGKPKSPEDFVDTDGDSVGDLASKDFQVIKVLKKNGDIQISGGSKVVVSGSYLEVVYPDFAIWEDVASGYVYPFIFTSDSDWNVDICTYVPTGYAIVGVYDENGNLLSDSSCTQTFISGETKVVAYDVVDIGSPEPVLGAVLSVSHEGEVTQVDVEVPGERMYVEEPAQLPNTGAGDSGGGTPVWPAVAALAGVSAMLLGGIAIWRRRRV